MFYELLLLLLIAGILYDNYVYNKRSTIWARLSDPWYTHVQSGKKFLEGRRFTEKWTQIKAGDTIVFVHFSDPKQTPIIRKVTSVQRFATFLDALNHYHRLNIMDCLLPGIKTPEEGAGLYLKFVRQVTQEKDGVVIIGLAL